MSSWMESVFVQFTGLNLPQGKIQTCSEKSKSLSQGWSRLAFATLVLAGVVLTCDCHSAFSPLQSIHSTSTSEIIKWSTFSWAVVTSKLTSESIIHLPFKSMEVFVLIKWVLDVSLKQLGLKPGHTEADGKEKLEFHPGVPMHHLLYWQRLSQSLLLLEDRAKCYWTTCSFS